MVTYSVYDPSTKQYTYFESREKSGSHAGSPKSSWGRSELGATPEQASWKVPAGSKIVGHGERPIGRIATHDGGHALDGLLELDDPMTWLIGAAAVWYLFLRKGANR